MAEAWLNLVVVALIQCVLLTAYAYHQGRLVEVPWMFGWGALMGIVFGLPLDLIVGKQFGLYSYTLGFTPAFLIVNWVLLNGLFAANTLLGQHLRLPYFFLWILTLMVAHEVPSHFFQVWVWQFSFPPVAYATVLIAGYFAGATMGAMVWHVFFRRRFLFIDVLMNK
ncbi:MAG: hypothetical protein RIQ56_912 [Candidatus Parcubacteria bacterium]|jgi:hypothetical protein